MDSNNISWVAPEYEHKEHGADWYWVLGIITVSLAVAFIIAGNMLLSIILIVGVGTLLVSTKHAPRITEYAISRSGIRAGETLYPWASLRSFWILRKDADAKDYHGPKILLISKKTFMPHIIIPIDMDVLDEVHDALQDMLPEEEYREPIAERLARKIGF